MEQSETTVAVKKSRHWRTLISALGRLRGADVTAVAAETSYYAILAIAPFLIFLIAGMGLVSQAIDQNIVEDFEGIVQRIAPGETGDLLSPLFEEAQGRASQGAMSFGMVTAFFIAMWSGSRAIGALLKGFGRIARDDNPPPAIWGRVMGLFLALVMVLLLLLTLTLMLFGGAMGRSIATWIGLGDTFRVIWIIVTWPLVILIVGLVISVLFRFASGASGYYSPGVAIATVMWLLIMIGIRLYLLIIDPSSVFGALGSFVVLVVFFYIMSLAMMFGAAINTVLRSPPVQGEEESSA